MDTLLLEKLLPDRRDEIMRLRVLSDHSRLPTAAVIGKYNHGKSTLLNTLIGEEVFRVSDIRETTRVQPHERDGIRWLDTPGLGADVQKVDDALAQQSIALEADIRLFVHAIGEGELDIEELACLQGLLADDRRSGRHTLVVLTRKERLSESELDAVVQGLREQVGQAPVFAVSASRYAVGKRDNKRLLVETSGIAALLDYIHRLTADLGERRTQARSALLEMLRKDIGRLRARRQLALNRLRSQAASHQADFDGNFRALCEQVRVQLQG